jgi:hypothetical protein
MKRILPVFTLLALLSSCAAGNGVLSVDHAPRYFFFDGASFAEGRREGVPSVIVRDGYYPEVVSGKAGDRLRRLPDGEGGVAGFCFAQVAGGKLGQAEGPIPLGGRDVTITGKGRKTTVRTDEMGFFVTALPEGRYEVELLGFSKTIDVKNGKSVVVTLRGGKRLVD